MSISVAIIGAGFAGIGAAIRLQDKGVDDFVLFERDTRVGGTWRDNTYPGAACDIPSRLYSYSFAPNPEWSHTYSGSGEILSYIDTMVESAGLRSRIRFEHTVTGLVYDADAGEWTISFADRDPVRARTVIVASGPLANASFPDIRGIEDYQGHMIHSARWDHDYDFAGKKVAVVGTGASAVQIVPEVVKEAASVKVFQRTPGWVLPRINTETGEFTKRIYRSVPGAQQLARALWFWGHESVALGVVWNTPLTRVVEAVSKLHLRAQVKDPWLRRQLTPDFAAGCKRLLMTSDYYPALQRANCKLVTWPIARIAPQGIRTVEGVEHRFDCIVFATGFDVSKAGTPIPITGLDGRVLADEWSGGAYAHRSVAVSGYPNLYFTFGPNSGPGHSSALVYMEAQIDYITDAVSQLLTEDWKALDVRAEVQDAYNRDIQRRLTATTWNSGCQSWYLTDDGFNATMFPGFASQYVHQLRRVDLRDFRILVREDAEAPVPAG
ncbi:FAD dependent oxidoreductase OS=Tsukamurella paurometabola (strain ATCC 8368 / DSM / CCUG 35730/ CIP 100753 / JCM 10117 / KCTC 9821 / NBRC 16120 / NCIMB 702349 / NCTC 13040) OX=521096 GN=Tpau_3513 PE=4 SV=1 [Tsukamurella paurometabola]|uniref:FAD dependent oxidoreductase n=1 Tax=Tsukamurella paurometabola (strain ATCC 8368 / DSM 20162 / CCUG 35730 / CIP 100753 / JCM 10117 / KCTC 9821 / NBRC 16120 / NCIMB 702349 / NCTC 13040) TaxID=521096 RepID=D5UX73_TSUPD|nr:NAD(P)/FAD-dependent oxidoreductase [Tsukamurella paurometabola]ADG80092.1 FAD dependent oxidoreductase [Tsukamurella paurometabola DSM 20162]SUP38386.1 4-hydroxyacetophenone monooxygenase [Tsukamurella paurometabola]